MIEKETSEIQRSLGRIEGDLKANTKSIQELGKDIKEIRKDTKEIPVLKKEISSLKVGFDNHLSHHKIKSRRWFDFMNYVFGGIIIGLVIYLITLLK